MFHKSSLISTNPSQIQPLPLANECLKAFHTCYEPFKSSITAKSMALLKARRCYLLKSCRRQQGSQRRLYSSLKEMSPWWPNWSPTPCERTRLKALHCATRSWWCKILNRCQQPCSTCARRQENTHSQQYCSSTTRLLKCCVARRTDRFHHWLKPSKSAPRKTRRCTCLKPSVIACSNNIAKPFLRTWSALNAVNRSPLNDRMVSIDITGITNTNRWISLLRLGCQLFSARKIGRRREVLSLRRGSAATTTWVFQKWTKQRQAVRWGHVDDGKARL